MSAYLYIDTRTISAPFGIVSLSEIEFASKNKLNGCEWSVYLTIVCIVSGRPNDDGVRIGLKQIMKTTGFSKSQIYKAIKKLNSIKLIEVFKHQYLLKNPDTNKILDQIIEEKAEVKNASHVMKKIKEKNQNLILSACEEPVNNSKKSLGSEKKDPEIESRIRDHAMSYKESITNSNYKSSKETIFRNLIPFLDLHFSSFEYTAREQLLDTHDSDNITAIMIQNWIAKFWINRPEDIADTLTNKRPTLGSTKPKRCLLNSWGWGYSTAPTTVTKWIIQYANYRLHD